MSEEQEVTNQIVAEACHLLRKDGHEYTAGELTRLGFVNHSIALAQVKKKNAKLEAHILDIQAHSTPFGGLPEDPEFVGTYLLTVGALHRALGTIGHSVAECACVSSHLVPMPSDLLTQPQVDALISVLISRLTEGVEKAKAKHLRVHSVLAPLTDSHSRVLEKVFDEVLALIAEVKALIEGKVMTSYIPYQIYPPQTPPPSDYQARLLAKVDADWNLFKNSVDNHWQAEIISSTFRALQVAILRHKDDERCDCGCSKNYKECVCTEKDGCQVPAVSRGCCICGVSDCPELKAIGKAMGESE